MATQSFEQLIAGANKIKTNELPESNTASLVGEQLIQMVNKQSEEHSERTAAISKEQSDRAAAIKAEQDARIKGTTEYNVSVQHPTGGISGTNKYTLETAIQKIPAELRTVGIKCSFIGEDGEKKIASLQTYEFQGSTYLNLSNWLKISSSIIDSLNHDMYDSYIKLDGVDISYMFIKDVYCNLVSSGKNYYPKNYVKLSGFSCFSMPVKKGDSFVITITGGRYDARAFATYDTRGTKLNIAGDKEVSFKDFTLDITEDGFVCFNSVENTELKIIAKTRYPESWSYLLFNWVYGLQMNQNDALSKIKKTESDVHHLTNELLGEYKSLSSSWEKGYIDVNSSSIGPGLTGAVDTLKPVQLEGFRHLLLTCLPGEKFIIHIKGGTASGRAYSFLNSKKQVLSQSSSGEFIDDTLVAPKDSSYIVFNSYNDSSYVIYGKKTRWQIEIENLRNELIPKKRTLKVLCFGNSFTEDSMGYVPTIFKNIVPNIDLTLVIAYIGGCPLAQHLANFTGEQQNDGTVYNPKPYNLHKSINGSSWQTIHNQTVDVILANEEWDIITFQQSGGTASSDWNTYYEPFIFKLQNTLFDKLVKSQMKPVRLGWLLIQGAYFSSDSTALNKWQGTADNARKVMEKTGFDVLFPFGTGVQNLRSTTLKSLGDGSAHNLCADNAHLQEGIGCLVAAYTNSIVLASLVEDNCPAIIGETTRPDKSFVDRINMPGKNLGTSGVIGISEKNCYLAQMAAITAVKSPYVVTDISIME